MDNNWGKQSPLNSITKLSNIHTKCRNNVENIRWVLAMIKDRIASSQSSLGDSWSVDALTGDHDKSRKGLVDLFLYKRDMGMYLLGPVLESHAFQSEAKEMLRAIFKTHVVSINAQTTRGG
jgi:hypothetical protein